MMEDKPWLQRKQWAANEITCEGRRGQWLVWGFALLWNAFVLPLMWQLDEVWQKTLEQPVTALAFLFPLVGVGVLVAAVRMSLNQRHFGPVPLFLDPFPGSLGGQVGGHIDTRIPFDAANRFTVTLSCVHSYISGSGKNRSRSESIKWQSNGVCHSERDAGGTRLSFRFDAPAGLPSADVERGNSYHLWRVGIAADLDGPDFHRRYDIPVFATGGQVSGIERGTEDHAATADLAMEGVESIADIRPMVGGIEASFPALRRSVVGISWTLFGLFFLAAGIGAAYGGASFFLAGIFQLLGSVFALVGLFDLGKSLLVSVTREGVRMRRFLFGYPLKSRQLSRSEVKKLKLDETGTMQLGRKNYVFYRILALGPGKQKLVLAERLGNRAEAELLLETYQAYLG